MTVDPTSGAESTPKRPPAPVTAPAGLLVRCTPSSRSAPPSGASTSVATKFSAAPVSYSLSLIAAVIYVVITVCLVRDTPRACAVAQAGMWIELVGVLVVGTPSIVDKDLFTNPETGKAVSSVWYWFGRDYLFVPLVLPILGLRFIRSSGTDASGHRPAYAVEPRRTGVRLGEVAERCALTAGDIRSRSGSMRMMPGLSPTRPGSSVMRRWNSGADRCCSSACSSRNHSYSHTTSSSAGSTHTRKASVPGSWSRSSM